MQIASQVLYYNMKRKYKTKRKNIINLDKFYNKFNKQIKDKDNGKRNISSIVGGVVLLLQDGVIFITSMLTLLLLQLDLAIE